MKLRVVTSDEAEPSTTHALMDGENVCALIAYKQDRYEPGWYIDYVYSTGPRALAKLRKIFVEHWRSSGKPVLIFHVPKGRKGSGLFAKNRCKSEDGILYRIDDLDMVNLARRN